MGEEQKNLVSVLDSVHNKLRLRKRQAKDDEEWRKVWEEHTSDFKTLQGYSSAMHQLATKIWDPRNAMMGAIGDNDSTSEHLDKQGKLKCRLEWVVSRCEDYFQVRRDSQLKSAPAPADDKLRLLDVGSCYNPFSKFDNYFDIVALDLCPAPGFERSVFQCDFLELNVIDQVEKFPMVQALDKDRAELVKLTELPKNSFDIIVFSYFLEYLADPEQRVACCQKAFNLLKPNGLLFVLRPDSNRVTPKGNNLLVKRMKLGMVLVGFKRIYFEKLEHLWCMAFKKLDESEKKTCMEWPYFKRDISKAGVEHLVEDPTGIHELFQISQDFKVYDEDPEPAGSQSASSQDAFNKELLDELVGGHDDDSDNS